ncbi:MAG TPA: multiheme c-type cytochrome [Alteraurantiacibacter sp.]
MKRLFAIVKLSGRFVNAGLILTAALSQSAVAASSEAVQSQIAQTRPELRTAQVVGAGAATDANAAPETAAPEAAAPEAEATASEATASEAAAPEATASEASVSEAAAPEASVKEDKETGAKPEEASGKAETANAKADPHSGVIDKETLSLYPTAAQCGECHQQIYEEWSSSNHAYASISPMFHKFEQKFQSLTQGTVGTFCVRCHQQVGTQLGEKRETPLWERSQISREGVSCITCHRVKEQYGKVNGERHVEAGKIYEPVYGSGEKSVIKDVLANKDTYSVKTSKDGRGNDIHDGMITNDQITKSEFCVSCHQVAVNLGIKLEIVWDQYRDSPARKAGVSCQDCHMGKVAGKPEGYATAPSAIVGGKEINPGRKHANHRFIGPGYSIAHPGIFPHNVKAKAYSIKDWLNFDWRAGWGTTEFEDKVADGKIKVDFPPRWASSFDREDARQIIEENLAKLDERDKIREQVMEASSEIDGPNIEGTPTVGRDLAFSYKIKNTNSGHNLPSGSLGAQPQLWVNVALLDPDGKNVWESGYVDSNGDLADLHSLDVAKGLIKTDQQLVNFQTKFLTTNVKGTDREMYLPVNFDIDPLPQLRPPQIPTSILNHPPLVRMENHSLPPLGEELASYNVPGDRITKPGKYRLLFRMRSRAEPIYFMRFVGSTKDMEQGMNERIMNFHAFAVELEVKG